MVHHPAPIPCPAHYHHTQPTATAIIPHPLTATPPLSPKPTTKINSLTPFPLWLRTQLSKDNKLKKFLIMICGMQFIKEKIKYKMDYLYKNVKNQTKPICKLLLDPRGNGNILTYDLYSEVIYKKKYSQITWIYNYQGI